MILIFLAALFLFGPAKLPELARSLGKAAGEFKKAQMEAEYDIKKPNKDAKIKNLASEMGLDAQNKTTEDLVEEIRTKIRSGENLPGV